MIIPRLTTVDSPAPGIWVTKDKRRMKVEEMESSHIANTMRLIERKTVAHLAKAFGDMTQEQYAQTKVPKLYAVIPVIYLYMLNELKKREYWYFGVATNNTIQAAIKLARSAATTTSITPEGGDYEMSFMLEGDQHHSGVVHGQ